MYYYSSTGPEPPMGRLAWLFFWVGLPIQVVGSFFFLPFLNALTGMGDGWSEDAFWAVWIGASMVFGALLLHLVHRLDAWDADRCLRRHSSADSSRVILHWRNRLFVNGRSSRPRLIAWFCLGPGNRILVFPVLTAVCVIVARLLASIDEPLLAAFVAGPAVVFAAITVQGLWERVHVIRKGRLLTGTVMDVGLDDALELYIGYRFLTPIGEEQAGAEHLRCRPRRMPLPGDHVEILYDQQIGARVM